MLIHTGLIVLIGAAVTGAMSMVFGANLLVPHGGIFVLLIPNAVTHLLLYVLSILVGTIVTAGMLFVLKKPVAEINEQLAETESVPA